MADRGDVVTEERSCPETGAKGIILISAEGQVAHVIHTGRDALLQIERTGVSPVAENTGCSALLAAVRNIKNMRLM